MDLVYHELIKSKSPLRQKVTAVTVRGAKDSRIYQSILLMRSLGLDKTQGVIVFCFAALA